MVFVQKGHFFNFFFLGNIRQECLLRYSIAIKRLYRLYKQEVQKVEKLTFFQRAYRMVLVQTRSFLQLFFLGNIGQENVFFDTLERKNAFLGYKKKKLKKWKY